MTIPPPPGTPVALAASGGAVAAVWDGGSRTTRSVGDAVAALPAVRWIWWSAPAGPTTDVRACWDLGAVGALAYGTRRLDPAAVWAAAHGLPAPDRREPDLFSAGGAGPVRDDGQLDPGWSAADPADTARRWAELALTVHQRQYGTLAAVPDPRGGGGRRLAVLTAYAESAAALLCRELSAGGLPVDRAVAGALLTAAIGSEQDAAAARADRDAAVLTTLPAGTELDLRSPDQVRAALARVGIDVPDTRSWRLEPHAAASPTVAALLAWRKADRLATTYGWRWLAERVGGGRLRGEWSVADGGAGRMTAGAGLHNLPAELRPAVRAEPGHVLVGADLGQVEPRVLAVVSGDRALAGAAGGGDLYAPIAAALRVNRPTAKVAVLAAMYGQTSGVAGSALRDLERVYPTALAYLRAAEQVGRDGGTLRTYGGRLLTFRPGPDELPAVTRGRGRYARNAMVQGAAAELFKAWAATVRAGLTELPGAEIILCLHDELLLQVPEVLGPQAVSLLRDALERTTRWWAAGSSARFVADVRTGASWPEVH